MTTAEEVKQDIDANWEGVYAALQAVVRLEKRVGKIEERLDELPDRIVAAFQEMSAGQPVIVGRKESRFPRD